MKNIVNIETIGGKKYFVARGVKGRFLGRKSVEGSRLTLQKARENYKQNGSFNTALKREIYQGTNFNEITITSSQRNKRGYIEVGRRPKGSKTQYVCRGNYKGETIVARSRFIIKGDDRKAQGSIQAKEEARKSFMERLGQHFNKNNAYAYTKALKMNILDELFKNHQNNGYSNKQKVSGYWTENQLQKEVNKYKTRNEFNKTFNTTTNLLLKIFD